MVAMDASYCYGRPSCCTDTAAAAAAAAAAGTATAASTVTTTADAAAATAAAATAAAGVRPRTLLHQFIFTIGLYKFITLVYCMVAKHL